MTELREALTAAIRHAQAGGLSPEDLADAIAEVVEHWRAEAAAAAAPDPNEIVVVSAVSVSSGDPLVLITVAGERWQWSPTDARAHAHGVLGAAEAAVHDAAMVRWMVLGPMGMDRDVAISALHDLRRFRGES